MAGKISKIVVEADQSVLWLFGLGPTGRKNTLLFAVYASFVLDKNPRIFHSDYPPREKLSVDVFCFCMDCGGFEAAPHVCRAEEKVIS